MQSPRFVFASDFELQKQLQRQLYGKSKRELDTEALETRAIETCVASELLASLPLQTPLPPIAVAARSETLKRGLQLLVGGPAALARLLIDASVSPEQLDEGLRRRARAAHALETLGQSAPMSESELERLYRKGQTPVEASTYPDAQKDLRAWADYRSLDQSLRAYFRKVKARVQVVRISSPATTAP